MRSLEFLVGLLWGIKEAFFKTRFVVEIEHRNMYAHKDDQFFGVGFTTYTAFFRDITEARFKAQQFAAIRYSKENGYAGYRVEVEEFHAWKHRQYDPGAENYHRLRFNKTQGKEVVYYGLPNPLANRLEKYLQAKSDYESKPKATAAAANEEQTPPVNPFEETVCSLLDEHYEKSFKSVLVLCKQDTKPLSEQAQFITQMMTGPEKLKQYPELKELYDKEPNRWRESQVYIQAAIAQYLREKAKWCSTYILLK